MDKIVIFASPTKMAKLFVFKNEELVEDISTTLDGFSDMVLTLAAQYNIQCIDINGVKAFTYKLGEDIAKKNIDKYHNVPLSIQYIR